MASLAPPLCNYYITIYSESADDAGARDATPRCLIVEQFDDAEIAHASYTITTLPRDFRFLAAFKRRLPKQFEGAIDLGIVSLTTTFTL